MTIQLQSQLRRILFIIAIPLALIIGVVVGYDFHGFETKQIDAATATVVELNEAYQQKLKTAELEVNLLLDINQGITPITEGEEKLKKLHEEMVEHNKRIDALNAKLEVK
jgi:hypothetical protein